MKPRVSEPSQQTRRHAQAGASCPPLHEECVRSNWKGPLVATMFGGLLSRQEQALAQRSGHNKPRS